MFDITTDTALMESIVKYIVPYLHMANEEFKDKCKIKMITFVNAHQSMENCETCKDEPIACLRCIVTVFPKKESDDSTAA